MIRTVLISDADITAYGVRQILDKDGEVFLAGVASNLEEGKSLIEPNTAQVVVLNTHQSRAPDPEALKEYINELKRVSKHASVVVLTDWSDKPTFDLYRSLDVKGYCLKTICEADLINAIKTVARGELYVHDGYAECTVQDNSLPIDNLDNLLGERQMEILNLILRGHTNREIAEELYISLPTVKSHVRVILRKLNARDRAHIIAKVLQGVLEKEPYKDLQ